MAHPRSGTPVPKKKGRRLKFKLGTSFRQSFRTLKKIR